MERYLLLIREDLNATLGKMHFLEGNRQKAKEYFQKTLTQTLFQAERDFIRKMIDRIGNHARK